MNHNPSFKIYNASAGSGKTYTLVQEFLLILLANSDVNTFSQLLAITFTNKAANEMKSRIIQKLQELSGSGSDSAEIAFYAKKLNLETHQVHQRAGKILTNILHNYGLFAVSTIDKFNLRLMRAFSQDLGLSINFDVEMDTKQMLSESVDLLFTELHDNQKLADILADIAIDNLSNNERWDISADMVNQSSELLKDKFIEQMQLLQKLSLEEFNDFRNKAKKKFFKARNTIYEAADKTLELIDALGLDYNDFKYKSSGSMLKYFEQVASGDIKKFSSRQQKMFDDETYLTNNQVDFVQIHTQIQAAYQVIETQIPDYVLWGKINKKINALTVINEIEKQFNALKNENNILLLSEFNKIISDNIKDQPIPFIYEKIGNRYNHYFIDEFQDTSTLQWQNLKPLVQNAHAENQTVMIVGDPKQSIYRWRGGNPNLMLGLSQVQDERIQVMNLETNYRSYEQIIHFNNQLYKLIANQIGLYDYKMLYEESHQKTNAQKGGFVQLRLQPKPQRGSGISMLSVCMEKLLEDIQMAESQGFAWDDMAILVRKNSDGQAIAEFLTEHNYKVISNESLLLVNSNEVQLLLAFVQFLAQPKLEEVRVNLVLQLQQHQLIDIDDITTILLEIIRISEAEFIIELKKLGVDLSVAFEPFNSLYDQISAALRAFGFAQNANAYVTFFMDEILKFQYQLDPTPQKFLEFWEQKGKKLSIAVPEGQNAIQLMTIHKSKGLQFPVVFLPYVTWSPKPSGIWIPLDDHQVKQFYVDNFDQAEFLPEEIQTLMELETIQSEMDSLNELYVATTRAVEQLYITTELLSGAGKPVASYLNDLVQLVNPDNPELSTFGEMKSIHSEENVENLKSLAENQIIVPFISSDWNKKVAISNEHILLWNESRAKAMDYGKKMHAVLEKLDGILAADDVIQRFVSQGLLTMDEGVAIKKELMNLFEHPKLKNAFSANDFMNERDFISSRNQVFRPDRLAQVDGKWILLDYKTGIPKSSHEDQINFYASELKELGMHIEEKYLVYLGTENQVIEVV